jgi:hypothetical protein
MGLLPRGTLNHFARDLGIPTQLEDAVRNVAEGRVREVDVVEANERVFVNNSSFGLYPAAVSLRNAWTERHGMQKWAAMARAALDTLRRFPVVRLTLRLDEGPERDDADVFIGSSRRDEAFRLGQAARAGASSGSTSPARRRFRSCAWPCGRWWDASTTAATSGVCARRYSSRTAGGAESRLRW